MLSGTEVKELSKEIPREINRIIFQSNGNFDDKMKKYWQRSCGGAKCQLALPALMINWTVISAKVRFFDIFFMTDNGEISVSYFYKPDQPMKEFSFKSWKAAQNFVANKLTKVLES